MAENHRGAAGFVVKILRGQKPGDLTSELPVTLELVVNLKTAKIGARSKCSECEGLRMPVP